MKLVHPLFSNFLHSKPYLIVILTTAATALILIPIPLVGDIGFEFALLMTLIATGGAGFITIYLVFQWRFYQETKVNFLSLVCFLLPLSLSILILPLTFILVKSWYSGFCNFYDGLAFFVLLPCVTTLCSAAVALLCSLLAHNKLRATILFITIILGSIGTSIYRLLIHPPLFAYNPFFGYFPGPIYDEIIVITPTLLIARGLVIIYIIAIIIGLYTCFDENTKKVRPSFFFKSGPNNSLKAWILSRLVFLLCLVALTNAYIYRSPLGIIIDRDYIQATLGGHKKTTNFEIYYDLRTISQEEIDLIALEHEYQLSVIAKFLNLQPPSSPIASYIYSTADQKKKLIGARNTSIERPGSDEIHLNAEKFPHPLLKHELVHALSATFGNSLYGGSYLMGLHEGLAVAVDWPSYPMNPHEWSRAMRVLKLDPPLEKILGTFGFWSSASSRSYTLCGSFVRFIIDQYGISSFKRVFSTGNFQEIYGRDLKQLTTEWESFIDQIKFREDDLIIARKRFIKPAIFNRKCPHEVARLNDLAWQAYSDKRYTEAAKNFNNTLKIDPNNLFAIRGLFYTTFRLEAYEKTAKVGNLIVNNLNQFDDLIQDVHLIRGDVSWRLGKLEDARSNYKNVLDEYRFEDIARAAFIRLEVIERDIARDLAMDFLLAGDDKEIKFHSMREFVDLTPDDPMLNYLVGRHLFLARSYQQAVPYLSKAKELNFPNSLIHGEILRLIALCDFYMKDYTNSLKLFEYLVTADISRSITRSSEIWINRCLWFQTQKHKDSSKS